MQVGVHDRRQGVVLNPEVGLVPLLNLRRRVPVREGLPVFEVAVDRRGEERLQRVRFGLREPGGTCLIAGKGMILRQHGAEERVRRVVPEVPIEVGGIAPRCLRMKVVGEHIPRLVIDVGQLRSRHRIERRRSPLRRRRCRSRGLRQSSRFLGLLGDGPEIALPSRPVVLLKPVRGTGIFHEHVDRIRLRKDRGVGRGVLPVIGLNAVFLADMSVQNEIRTIRERVPLLAVLGFELLRELGVLLLQRLGVRPGERLHRRDHRRVLSRRRNRRRGEARNLARVDAVVLGRRREHLLLPVGPVLGGKPLRPRRRLAGLRRNRKLVEVHLPRRRVLGGQVRFRRRIFELRVRHLPWSRGRSRGRCRLGGLQHGGLAERHQHRVRSVLLRLRELDGPLLEVRLEARRIALHELRHRVELGLREGLPRELQVGRLPEHHAHRVDGIGNPLFPIGLLELGVGDRREHLIGGLLDRERTRHHVRDLVVVGRGPARRGHARRRGRRGRGGPRSGLLGEHVRVRLEHLRENLDRLDRVIRPEEVRVEAGLPDRLFVLDRAGRLHRVPVLDKVTRHLRERAEVLGPRGPQRPLELLDERRVRGGETRDRRHPRTHVGRERLREILRGLRVTARMRRLPDLQGARLLGLERLVELGRLLDPFP